MATGRITTIRADKGFGFIMDSSGNGNNELFFHRSAVVGIEFDDLREGQEVSFESGPDPRDPSAVHEVSPYELANRAPAMFVVDGDIGTRNRSRAKPILRRSAATHRGGPHAILAFKAKRQADG